MRYQTLISSNKLILEIEGKLDATTASEIRGTINSIVTGPCPHVVVDLAKLELIDASGVGAIVSLYKRMRTRDGDVVIKNLQKQPAAIFKLLGIDRALKCE